MAFVVNARVRVTDQTSQHRGRLGVVKSVDGNHYEVRLDGHPDRKTFLLLEDQLQRSTQPLPVDYPNDVAPVTEAVEDELAADAAEPSEFNAPVEPKEPKEQKKAHKPKG